MRFAKRACAGLLLLCALGARADTTSYAFATATTGALDDTSSGTTQLVGPGADDVASTQSAIGFDFFLLGTRYTTFSASSNGALRLGGPVGATTYALGAAGVPLLGCMLSDNMTQATSGKVHYKLTGAAPNRVLVVEFRDLTLIYDGVAASADGTCQVRLHETSGQVELVYGAMRRNASSGFAGSMDPQHIGFSTDSTAGKVASVDAANTMSTSGVTPNQFPRSAPMASLDSAAQGARRVYTFTPPVPAAPTALAFSAVAPLAMTLNWSDAPNEKLYAIYRSTDGVSYAFQSTLASGSTSFVATGLAPGTTYFWRVFAVSDGALSTALAGAQATASGGAVASTAAGGNWSNPATWTGGAVPTATDNVTIASGATVTIDAAAVALSLHVANAATLVYEAATPRTLSVGAGVTIDGTFSSASTGAVTTHTLVVGADLANNGTLDFSTNANSAGAGITFTGANSNTFGGSGTTDVRAITIDKGSSSAPVLTASNFTVRGASTDVAGFLTLANGTFRLAGAFVATNRVFAASSYTIGATAGFWLDNPNFTVAAQNASATQAGLLRVTQGTFNVGTGSGNSIGFASGSTTIVEGGAINVAGRFGVSSATNTIAYAQTAGTITVSRVGNASTALASFDLGTSLDSTISITGGTIVAQLAATGGAGPRDYRNQAGSGSAGVTGGTLRLGNASSGAAQAFTVAGVVPNLVVTGAHGATFDAPLNYANLARDITLEPGATLDCGNNAFLFGGATLTNNGTLKHDGALSSFVWFRSDAPQLYTGTGIVTAPMTRFEMRASMGLTLDPASPMLTASTVRIISGSITNASRLRVGNGGSTAATIEIGNDTPPTDAGFLDGAPTFNPGAGGVVLRYLRTSAARATGFEVPPSRSIASLTFDDPAHPLTLAGGDLTVTGTTTLANGRVVTGANTLSVAAVARTAGWIDGNLRKTFAATGSSTFEVGTANGYSPVIVDATAGTFPATLTAKATQSTAPGFAPATQALTRHWTLAANGVTANLTFAYLDPADIPGTLAEGSMHVYRGAGGYTDLGGTIDTAANTGAIAGVNAAAIWTLAAPGGGGAGKLAIDPATRDFGVRVVGSTSAFETIALGNDGVGTLSITGLTPAAPPFARTSDGTCGNSLPLSIASGASCTLSYTFVPNTAGTASQSFNLTTTATGATQFTLQGTGVLADRIFADGFE